MVVLLKPTRAAGVESPTDGLLDTLSIPKQSGSGLPD